MKYDDLKKAIDVFKNFGAPDLKPQNVWIGLYRLDEICPHATTVFSKCYTLMENAMKKDKKPMKPMSPKKDKKKYCGK